MIKKDNPFQSKANQQNTDHISNNGTSHKEPRHIGEAILARKLRWTKLVMFFEQLWLKSWAPITVVGIFLLTCLYQLWPLLSPLMHRLILAFFAMGLIASFYPFFSLRWPKEAKALKRLDHNSTLPHQPAQAFKDNLELNQANGQTRALWLTFKDRLVEKISKLKVRPPQPDTSKSDPYALRMLMMLALVIGVFIQGGNVPELVAKALKVPPMTSTADLRIDAWVTPPTYTSKAPILIADGGKLDNPSEKRKTNFSIPQNSVLTVRINGKNANYVQLESNNRLLLPDGSSPADKSQKDETKINDQPVVAKKPATNSVQSKSQNKTNRDFNVKLTENGHVKVTIDKIPLTDWTFNIEPDNPPVIGLIEIPSRAQSGALKLKYRVADDYGVTTANAHVKDVQLPKETSHEDTPPEQQDSFESEQQNQFTSITANRQQPLGAAFKYPLNLTGQSTTEAEGTTFKDLTSHPWAGFEVTLYLSAADEGQNKSNSPEIKIQLPEYNFTKQIARDIIALRKRLVITPHESAVVALSLIQLTHNKKPFEKDLTLYLGLRVTANRLLSSKTRKDKEQLASLLYELARHAEDGDLSAAERELRTAQEALRNALKENAPNSEIQKRIDELRKALQKYMQALAKQQQKQNAENNQQSQDQNQKNVSPEDFEQMLKTIEELAKSGSKDLARQMLSQLQNMLENIQTGKNRNQQQQNQSAKELEELGKILREQQELMDKTFEQSRQQRQQNRQNGENSDQNQNEQNQQGQRQQGNSNQLQQQQQALRQKLQEFMKKLQQGQQGQRQGQREGQQQGQRDGQQQGQMQGKGRQGNPLENADKAMGRAGEMLKDQELGNALSQEGQALDQLRKGMEQMAKQMQERSGKGKGQNAGGTDPLGRSQNANGMDTSETTKIPDKIDIQRAREILRNLQDKLSDPNRPAPEIDYIERLLKRF